MPAQMLWALPPIGELPVQVTLTCVRHYRCDRPGWDCGSRYAAEASTHDTVS